MADLFADLTPQQPSAPAPVDYFSDIAPAAANFGNVGSGAASTAKDFPELVPDYRAMADQVPDSPIAAPSVAGMNADALGATWSGLKQAGLDAAANVADTVGDAWNTLKGVAYGAAAPTPAAPLLLSAAQAEPNSALESVTDAQAANLAQMQADADLRARQQSRMQSLRDGSLLDSAAYYAKEGAGNIAPIAAAVGIGAVAPETAPILLPALFGGQAAADTYGQQRIAGADPEQASDVAIRSGAINAALAAVPGHVIATPFANPLLKTGALALSNEAITAAGAPLTMAADEIAGDANYAPSQYLDATAEAAKSGVLPSLALGALGARSGQSPVDRIRALADQVNRSAPKTPEAAAVDSGRAAAASVFDAAGVRPDATPAPVAAAEPAKPVTTPAPAVPREESPRTSLPADSAPQAATADVQRAAQDQIAALSAKPKLTRAEKFTLDFLRQHADNPDALAEGLGMKPADSVSVAKVANLQPDARERFADSQESQRPALADQPPSVPETPAVAPQAEPGAAATTPRIQRLQQQAADINAKLPPIARGMTRMWRGNRPGEIGKATQFTNDAAGIAIPFRDAYKGELSYVDIPTADLGKYEQSGAAAKGAEFNLPADISARAKSVQSESSLAPVAPPVMRSQRTPELPTQPGAEGIEASEITGEEADRLIAEMQARQRAALDEKTDLPVEAFKTLAENPAFFRNKLLPGKTPSELAKQAGGIQYAGRSNVDGIPEHAFVVDQGEGGKAEAKMYDDGNSVWVDVSKLKSGGGAGERVYNMAFSYALNNGRNFKEDPAGLSDTAVFRRPVQQLGSILKAGSAENIEPGDYLSTDPKQRPGAPKTRPIQYDAQRRLDPTLREHLLTTYHNAALATPQVENVEFDPKQWQFVDRTTGRVVDDAGFDRLASDRRAQPVREAMVRVGDAESGRALAPAPIGGRSLKEAALVGTLLRAKPSDASAILGEYRRRAAGGDGLGALENLLPSKRETTPANAGVSASEAPKAALTLPDMQEATRKAFGSAKVLTRLVNSGTVEPITRAEAVERGLGTAESLEGVKGLHDGKKAYLITDEVQPHEVAGVLTHEVGVHHSMEKILGPESFRGLQKSMEHLRTRGDADVKRAYDAVPDDTPAKHVNHEAMAYLAEESPNHSIAQKMVDGTKLFLNRLGIPMDWLKAEPAAIRKIARESLLAESRGETGGVRTYRGANDPLYQKVFHGTPHRGIEKEGFKLNKIGTGEGAQAYGWGAYFASSRDVAEHYRKNLSGEFYAGTDDAGKWRVYGKGDKAVSGPYENSVDAGNAAREAQSKAGQLYHAEIPEDHDLLDWDKPLSEQPEKVRAALTKLPSDFAKAAAEVANGGRARDVAMKYGMNPLDLMVGTGGAFYGHLAHDLGGEQAASHALQEAGIPGLRYLDGSSRNAGEGSHNYVIWDEAHLNNDVTPYYSKRTDPDRTELPQGHDNSDALKSARKDKTADLPLAHVSEAKDAGNAIRSLSPKHVQELGRGTLRAALAQRDRAVAKADASVRAFMDHFDKRPRAVLSDPRQALEDVIRFERGEPAQDPVARPFFAATRVLLDKQAEQIRSFGKGYLDHLVEDYFPHQWKDPERAEAVYQGIGRKPLAGDKRFTKQRTFQTTEDGLNAGMVPVSNNPVDLLMARYQSGERLLASLRVMKELEDRGWVRTLKPEERIPQGWARVNDNAFNGKVIPELIARDLNNHLDPGLSRFKAWRSFRFGQNVILSARLGLSAFHAGMTTIDTIATHADIGWRRAILLGDLKGGLMELARIPGAIVTSPIRGTKLLHQFFGESAADPHTAAILDMLTEGGARGRMNPVDYNDSFAKFRRAWKQGDLKAGTAHAIPAAIEATTRLIAHHLVPAQKMIARVMHAKFRLDELADKLGKDRGDYAGTIDALHPDTLRQIAYEINATIDDRLGQFAYDNLFWNKTLKDALHASVQSVGWNYGSLRLLLGGIGDVRKIAKPENYIASLDKAGMMPDAKMSRLTDRLSYLITLNAVVAAAGATLQYAMTGESPKELKDFFFPRTGRKNPDDSDERISFPSYVKDEYALATHPLTTASHKLHPTFSMLSEIAKNKDFYGTQVYDPDASIPTEAKQFMAYLGKSFLPYAVTGAAKSASTGKSATMTALPFVGITPAAGDISKTPFQEFVADRYFDTLPQGARTQEKAEQSQKFREAVMALRAGQEPDTTGMVKGQIKALHRAAKTEVPEYRFSRLGIVEQLKAYKKATPEERDKYHLRRIILHKHGARISRLPEDEREDVQAQVGSIADEP